MVRSGRVQDEMGDMEIVYGGFAGRGKGMMSPKMDPPICGIAVSLFRPGARPNGKQ